jgi:hypothetical protein
VPIIIKVWSSLQCNIKVYLLGYEKPVLNTHIRKHIEIVVENCLGHVPTPCLTHWLSSICKVIQSSLSSTSGSPSSSSSERTSVVSWPLTALSRNSDTEKNRIDQMEYIPDSNTKDKVVPEEVQELEKENRDKNLVFHPPDHPYSVFR